MHGWVDMYVWSDFVFLDKKHYRLSILFTLYIRITPINYGAYPILSCNSNPHPGSHRRIILSLNEARRPPTVLPVHSYIAFVFL